MLWFLDLWVFVRHFLEAGGQVLIVISALLLVQWALVVERFYFFYVMHPKNTRQIIVAWHARQDTTSWAAQRIREAWLSQVSQQLNAGIILIKTLVAICPLVGLLGMVWGMIAVFEVLAKQGPNNTTLLASAISMAIIPTLAGMVAAIVGLFISHRIERMANERVDALADSLPHH